MKVYALSFFSGDAWQHIPDLGEVYLDKKAAEKRKQQYFKLATDDPYNPNYNTFSIGDWWDDENQDGIEIEEIEVK
jgi:hypothetical protein